VIKSMIRWLFRKDNEKEIKIICPELNQKVSISDCVPICSYFDYLNDTPCIYKPGYRKRITDKTQGGDK